MQNIPFYRQHPFTRLIVPLIGGILLAHFFKTTPPVTYFLAGTILILIMVLLSLPHTFKTSYLKGITISAILMLVGYINPILQNKNISTTNKNQLAIARIEDIPTEKQNSYKATLLIQGIKTEHNWQQQQIKIIAYFEKDSQIKKLKAGQYIVFKAPLDDLGNNLNKIGFNYDKYLLLKGIDRRVYLKSSHWKALCEKSSGIKARALNLRAKIIAQYKKLGITADEMGVLSALTVGYKNNLSAEIKQAYAGAGAMHVLAVSGLHVGIVYLIVNTLLGFLGYFKKSKPLKHLLIILALWTYAFLTGLSPSVTRSALMFSFILMGFLFDKRINIYNSLAASAFLLLLIRPNLLFNVGFQLSYVAVAGIVFFQPKIYKAIYAPGWFLDKIWQLTSVSLAAQWVTFPLAIYYFHQFPVYFWLSNMVVILAASLLIYLTILLMFTGFVPAIQQWLGNFIDQIIHINNQFIYWINDLPGAVINNISINIAQFVGLLLIIVLFGRLLLNPEYKTTISLLSAILFFTIATSFKTIRQEKQIAFNVYQIRGQSFMQWIDGKQITAIANFGNDSTAIHRIKTDATIFWNARNKHTFSLQEIADTTIHMANFYFKQGFWMFKNKSGLILNKNSKIPILDHPLALDYLIVTQSPPFKRSYLKNLCFRKTIIDGSVPPWVINDWKDENCHITSEQGAYFGNNFMRK